MKKKYNYYREELNRVSNYVGQYPNIKITNADGNTTKWLSLSLDSIDEVMLYLNNLKIALKEGEKEFYGE